MKKFLSLILAVLTLLLCSCSSGNDSKKVSSSMIEINYDKISRRNNRIVLMGKYDYVMESIEYFNLDTTEEVPNWTLEYSADANITEQDKIYGNSNIDAKFVFGNEKHYYYNNAIYVTIDEDDNRCFVPFNSNYDTEVEKALKRENTLNYVYYNQVEGFKTDTGYAVSYWFTLSRDVLDDFQYWNVRVGDIIKVDYNLNNDYEILDYTYYIVQSNEGIKKSVDDLSEGDYTTTKIMTSTTTFNKPYKFPDFVYKYDKSPKINLTVKSNYETSFEITSTFSVPSGIKLLNDDLFTLNSIYTDERLETLWDYENDVLTKDTTFYAVPLTVQQ